MSLQTVIKWREYPNEKPSEDEFIYATLHKSGVMSENYWNGKYWESSFEGDRKINTVTHFALPEDITTTESLPVQEVLEQKDENRLIHLRRKALPPGRDEGHRCEYRVNCEAVAQSIDALLAPSEPRTKGEGE